MVSEGDDELETSALDSPSELKIKIEKVMKWKLLLLWGDFAGYIRIRKKEIHSSQQQHENEWISVRINVAETIKMFQRRQLTAGKA